MNVIILLLIYTSYPPSKAFSTGPPPSLCMSPYPHHFNNDFSPILAQQGNTSPYVIRLNTTNYTDGMVIKVVITSNIASTFKGIVLTFKPNTSEIAVPIGQFLSCDAPGLQFYTVQMSNNSCLVHANADPKPSTVTCIYIAPSANYDVLRLSAVIVNSYTTFWARLEQTLRYAGASPLQPIDNPTQILLSDLDLASCAQTKSCILFPNLCMISNTCVYVFTYQRSGSYVNFEMAGPDKGYLAIGISSDAVMNNDLVLTCVEDPDTNTLLVQTGFTTWIPNISPIAYYSADKNVINRRGTKSRILKSTRVCSFSIPVSLIYPYNVSFPTDLSQKLNIFFANGDTYPNTPFLRMHSEPPLMLVTSTVLSSASVYPNTYFKGLDFSKKIHGTLMTVAFVFLLPLAVMVARHFRYQARVNVHGKQLWFYIHVVLNILFYMVAFAGYFYIISQVTGYWESEIQIHGSVGTVVMILAAINIIVGFSRPDIGTPRRPYFYWAHFLNGSLIRLLSIATFWLVIFTITLRMAFKNWMMIVVVIWTGGELMFSLVFGILRQKKRVIKSKDKYQVSDETVPAAQQNHVGHFGLVLYVLFVVSLLVALLCGLWIN